MYVYIYIYIFSNRFGNGKIDKTWMGVSFFLVRERGKARLVVYIIFLAAFPNRVLIKVVRLSHIASWSLCPSLSSCRLPSSARTAKRHGEN